jgi:predicted aspartyl protease
MIYGRLIDGKAIVPVIFRLPTQPDFSIDFIIDTGFNDHLARLADGREALLSIHLATIVWDNREKVVPILASGYKPLLGTALMEGYHLEIDFEDNGLVLLEQIPFSQRPTR